MKPKTFFYIMLFFSIIAGTFAFICFMDNRATASVIGAIISFVFLYGATISPSNNNYD